MRSTTTHGVGLSVADDHRARRLRPRSHGRCCGSDAGDGAATPAREHEPSRSSSARCRPGRRRRRPSTRSTTQVERSSRTKYPDITSSSPRSTTGRRRPSRRSSRAARCRTCSRSRSPTARAHRPAASSPTSPSASRRCLRRQVQPQRPRRRPGRRRQDLRPCRPPAYGMALHYNRDAVRRRPVSTRTSRPTTWDEVRDGRQDDRRRDRPGRATPDGHEQHRRLAADHRDLRARRPDAGVDEDGKVTSTINNDATKAGARVLQGHALGGRLDGLQRSTIDWGTINQAFAAGQIGMYTGGSDVYTALVQTRAQPGRLRPDGPPARRGAERRRPRRRHARRGQRRRPREDRARRRRRVDRLLLHAEAADRGRAPSPTPRPSPPTTSRSARPPLPIFDQATLRGVAGLDQGLHQRPARPDDAVHRRRSSTSRSSPSRPRTPRSCTRPSTRSCRPC